MPVTEYYTRTSLGCTTPLTGWSWAPRGPGRSRWYLSTPPLDRWFTVLDQPFSHNGIGRTEGGWLLPQCGNRGKEVADKMWIGMIKGHLGQLGFRGATNQQLFTVSTVHRDAPEVLVLSVRCPVHCTSVCRPPWCLCVGNALREDVRLISSHTVNCQQTF